MPTLTENLEELTMKVTWLLQEHQHIADVLAAFCCAPISMSSVQPVLDLAVQLNPSLRTEAQK